MTTRSPRRPRPRARGGPSTRRSAAAALALALAASVAVALPAGTASADPAPADPTPVIANSATDSAPRDTAARAAQVHAPVPTLRWTACASTPGGPDLSDFQCAQALVPLDYDRPNGAATTIALTRLPATTPGKRIGTLFTNPGGPGGSGVEFIQTAGKTAYTPAVRERFDILGFDPRTVGASDPATCYPSAAAEESALASVPAFPVGTAQERRFVLQNAGLGIRCTWQSGQRIAHSSTANVARDMDLLRQAVGDAKLSYVGYSYGTYLGATYAQLFPGRIRAFVLDGTMNPDAYSGSDGDRRPVGARIGQGPAAYETYGEFLRLCAAGGADACPLAELGTPRAVVDAMLDRLKAEPLVVDLPDGTSQTFTYATTIAVMFTALYSPAQWPDLASLLALFAVATDPATSSARTTAPGGALRDGRPQLTDRTGELVRQVPTPGSPAARGTDYPSVGGSLSSLCVDTAKARSLASYPKVAASQDRVAPGFGAYRAWVGVTCEFVGVRDDDAYRGPWDQKTSAPVLVIGTRFDPATPFRYTAPYAAHFKHARVLTVTGWGHTILGKSTCADQRVADYLITGRAAAKATCAHDYRPFVDPAPAPGARSLQATAVTG